MIFGGNWTLSENGKLNYHLVFLLYQIQDLKNLELPFDVVG